ncbi:hypothetical protein ACJMK2_024514 [Sinanodonta woodiana]|uniref:Biogenesis of lysosome-related organelles complex 1 subunit 6 n=1 Tax=Sinanodonta woodiana TaxID=1069815 RepID=A0ABD3XHI6_SINWO
METIVETVPKESSPSSAVIESESSVSVDPRVIECMAHGMMEMFLPNLQKSKSLLNEVLQGQAISLETVQQENAKFADTDAVKEITATMEETKRYYAKLVALKKEMQFLTEKSEKLKRQAVKLQQQKQREEIQLAQQREREMERERMLEAKVANRQISNEDKPAPT